MMINFISINTGNEIFSLQLKHEGRTRGLFSIAFPCDLGDEEEEQTLLINVVGAISFALHSIELDEERQQTEKPLERNKQALQRIFGLLVLNKSLLTFISNEYNDYNRYKPMLK